MIRAYAGADPRNGKRHDRNVLADYPPSTELNLQSRTSRSHEAHGLAHTSEYRIWAGMRQRCLNPRTKSFPKYGGRGIAVCPRWASSFAAFLTDVGPRPSPKHSLDRIDNDGNYEPGNVRWATRIEQANNRTDTSRVTVGSETRHINEWAVLLGVSPRTLLNRLRAWPPATGYRRRGPAPPPKQPKARRGRLIEFRGETRTLEDWAELLALPPSTIRFRPERGWTVEEALSAPSRPYRRAG